VPDGHALSSWFILLPVELAMLVKLADYQTTVKFPGLQIIIFNKKSLLSKHQNKLRSDRF
jgi:hypothetical protein